MIHNVGADSVLTANITIQWPGHRRKNQFEADESGSIENIACSIPQVLKILFTERREGDEPVARRTRQEQESPGNFPRDRNVFHRGDERRLS